MANRTVKFYGNAHAENGNVSVVVNYNGVEVYNGEVVTSPTPIDQVSEMVELGSFQSDTLIEGTVPVSMTVTNGTLAVQAMEADHNQLIGTYGDTIIDETSASYVAFAPLHAGFNDKNTIRIDDVAHATDNSYMGSWVFLVNDGQRIEYNQLVDPVQTPPVV
jgi:hypothetical protein